MGGVRATTGGQGWGQDAQWGAVALPLQVGVAQVWKGLRHPAKVLWKGGSGTPGRVRAQGTHPQVTVSYRCCVH